jgi:hypothetical protein
VCEGNATLPQRLNKKNISDIFLRLESQPIQLPTLEELKIIDPVKQTKKKVSVKTSLQLKQASDQ